MLINLERAEHGHVDVAAAHHRERVGAAAVRRAWQLGDDLLARVDEVRIDLRLERVRAHAEHPVLRMQRDVDARRHEVGDERGHADAEVDVIAILQLTSDALHDPFAKVHDCPMLLAAPPAMRRRRLRRSGESRTLPFQPLPPFLPYLSFLP